MKLLEELRKWLTSPGLFPETGPVELRETHISLVALTASHVYKFRKPVTFDFLDFSTREARYVDCWNEVLLNRRLTEDIYLDVVPLFVRDGRPRLGNVRADSAFSSRSLPREELLRAPIDWCVRMQRLPDKSSLESMLVGGMVTRETLQRLMARLKPFFRAAPAISADRADNHSADFRASLIGNFDVLDRFANCGILPSAEVRSFRSRQLQLFVSLRKIFEDRLRDGWVRECHGDLRADHIYLLEEDSLAGLDKRENGAAGREAGPSVQIIDCVEFRRSFREVDILDECSFLAFDLERLGHPDLAAAWLEIYRTEMQDDSPAPLAELFLSYRAAVRSKVAALQSESAEPRKRPGLEAEANRLLEIAQRHLSKANIPTLLVVMVGLSGTGKSTAARQLAAEIGAVRIASDEVRKENRVAPAGPDRPTDQTATDQLYSSRSIQNVYGEMLRRAEGYLRERTSVILDATHLARGNRDGAALLAQRYGATLRFVQVNCDDAVVRQRLIDRKNAGNDPSDADVTVYERQRGNFEELTPAERALTIRVDSEVCFATYLSQIVSGQEVV